VECIPWPSCRQGVLKAEGISDVDLRNRKTAEQFKNPDLLALRSEQT